MVLSQMSCNCLNHVNQAQGTLKSPSIPNVLKGEFAYLGILFREQRKLVLIADETVMT
jgi:hypothetical protein